MGIGTSLVLIGIGAILKYAVTADVQGVDLDVVGVILMIIGIAGLVISLLYLAVWSDRRHDARYEPPPPPPRDRF
jgi:uncharacterized membrane protein YuzA (DUF378 family)